MAEITTPAKPQMHSSVDAMKRAVEAKNASQKADLMFEGPQAQKKMNDRLAALEKQLEGIRQRIEVLESEDNIPGTPYMG